MEPDAVRKSCPSQPASQPAQDQPRSSGAQQTSILRFGPVSNSFAHFLAPLAGAFPVCGGILSRTPFPKLRWKTQISKIFQIDSDRFRSIQIDSDRFQTRFFQNFSVSFSKFFRLFKKKTIGFILVSGFSKFCRFSEIKKKRITIVRLLQIFQKSSLLSYFQRFSLFFRFSKAFITFQTLSSFFKKCNGFCKLALTKTSKSV